MFHPSPLAVFSSSQSSALALFPSPQVGILGFLVGTPFKFSK